MLAMLFFRSVSPVVGVVFRECSITRFTKGLEYLLMVKTLSRGCDSSSRVSLKLKTACALFTKVAIVADLYEVGW
jgi:hypothetical protein